MHPVIKNRLAPGTAHILGRLLGKTLRWTIVGEEPMLAKDRENGFILVTWHGRTLVPIIHLEGRGYWSMISTSSDGEFMNSIFRKFGFNTVRGSRHSARGAIKATLALIKQLHAGAILALTPDGPRGPMHTFEPGAIYLAMKSGCPIVPAGISASPRCLWKSWDRYMIPYPFAKVAYIYGEPIYIPPNCSQAEMEQWADKVGRAIKDLEEQADRMVGIAADPAPSANEASALHRA